MIKLVSGRVEIRMAMDQKERSGEAGLGGIHPGPEGEVVAKTPLRIVAMRVKSQTTSLRLAGDRVRIYPTVRHTHTPWVGSKRALDRSDSLSANGLG